METLLREFGPRIWRGEGPVVNFFNHILAWPIERAVVAHGETVAENGGAFVSRAFLWLEGGAATAKRRGDPSAPCAS
jgi:hypothetical protein